MLKQGFLLVATIVVVSEAQIVAREKCPAGSYGLLKTSGGGEWNGEWRTPQFNVSLRCRDTGQCKVVGPTPPWSEYGVGYGGLPNFMLWCNKTKKGWWNTTKDGKPDHSFFVYDPDKKTPAPTLGPSYPCEHKYWRARKNETWDIGPHDDFQHINCTGQKVILRTPWPYTVPGFPWKWSTPWCDLQYSCENYSDPGSCCFHHKPYFGGIGIDEGGFPDIVIKNCSEMAWGMWYFNYSDHRRSYYLLDDGMEPTPPPPSPIYLEVYCGAGSSVVLNVTAVVGNTSWIGPGPDRVSLTVKCQNFENVSLCLANVSMEYLKQHNISDNNWPSMNISSCGKEHVGLWLGITPPGTPGGRYFTFYVNVTGLPPDPVPLPPKPCGPGGSLSRRVLCDEQGQESGIPLSVEKQPPPETYTWNGPGNFSLKVECSDDGCTSDRPDDPRIGQEHLPRLIIYCDKGQDIGYWNVTDSRGCDRGDNEVIWWGN
ncbi:protein TE37 [Testudinid alphaherpesvirus 3]|nr:protein TE37 [Testudinid alphaherpesvirus 3]AIU39310.1 protein TE37 [Testudinid alphaherpesvirus 3]AIU39420.1 protein TE37 [Testudinid alphaherpesvirus 3]AKI81696.1 protein TE37 [Testudinid alphaherpesvirus 3]AKI81799.1 protein TE37 [Testudinid alphaherpesvirus 3]